MEAVTVVQVLAVGAALALVVIRLWRDSERPSIIEKLERSMVSNQNRLDANQSRLDAQEGEIDELRRQLLELQEGRLEDHRLLQVWIDYARRLGALFRELTGQEPPAEPVAPAAVAVARPGRSWLQLATQIKEHFSLSEINDLAFEMDLQDVIQGGSVEERASSLVVVARRRERLGELVALCRRKNPRFDG